MFGGNLGIAGGDGRGVESRETGTLPGSVRASGSGLIGART
jgi:hypothetical protein